jgi:hypothetical protein
MKTKILGAITVLAVAFVGMGIGSLDSIYHSQKATAQLAATCKAQPQLDECMERQAAVDSVRYFFNGQEFRDGNSVTTLGANK